MKLQNILIIKLSAIGDVIHALPVARAIKERFPEARITWVVEPPAYDLLTNTPYIDEIILFEKKKFKSLGGFIRNIQPLAKKLRRRKYDAVLDLQGLFKSAALAALARSDRKLGCCNMREGSDRISRPVCGPHARGHIVERYLDVARELGCKIEGVGFPLVVTEREAVAAEKIMAHAGVPVQNPYVVLAVGANWPNKRWPTAKYAALVNWLYDRKIIPVLIGGGVVDERLAAEIAAAAEIPPVSLVGRTTLKQLAHVVKNSRAVVGGDTGPVHLAAGLCVPVIMLMGPTDAGRNGPYGQMENVIEAGRECRHCWKRQCIYQRDCLDAIGVMQVTGKLETMLQ